MTAAPPEDVLRWVVAAVDPAARVEEVTGLREGGAPWLVRLTGGRDVVLRSGGPDDGASLATEVAALELLTSAALPTPRLLGVEMSGQVGPGHLAVVTSRLPGTSRCSGPPPLSRFAALGTAAAAVHAVPAPAPSAALPHRDRTLPSVDFAALRRAAPAQPLLQEAEAALAALPTPSGSPVLVHGDLWQGNTLWDGDSLTGVIDWDCAGVGLPGIDVGSLRCDAAVTRGPDAAQAVLAAWERAMGRVLEDGAYWDLVAGLATPPDMAWFVTAIRDQGRVDLDGPTMLARRDAFLVAALERLS